MTQILLEENGIFTLTAISREEDLVPNCRILVNAPPSDGRCEVCGKHISELKPFGGPGDLLGGKFSGERLVQNSRPYGPYDEAAVKAWQEAGKAVSGPEDILPWLISKYGEKVAENISDLVQLHGAIGASWECRDCIALNEDEYFEAIYKRSKDQEQIDGRIGCSGEDA